MTDEATAPRWGTLHELLTRAEALGLHVQLNIHRVPVENGLDWLQLGLLDSIEKGAASNPPTGRMTAGTSLDSGTDVVAFLEDEDDRRRRIAREEDAAVEKLAADLEGSRS